MSISNNLLIEMPVQFIKSNEVSYFKFIQCTINCFTHCDLYLLS